MYGMINEAAKLMIVKELGIENWLKVSSAAKCPETFDAVSIYDDAMTYDIIAAASELTSLSEEELLASFGEFWIDEIAAKEYESLLCQTGGCLFTCLQNLDVMHQRLESMFKGYRPPSFRVVEDDSGMFLKLDYYSERKGLLPFLVGIIQGLSRYYKQPTKIEVMPIDSNPMPCETLKITFVDEEQ